MTENTSDRAAGRRNWPGWAALAILLSLALFAGPLADIDFWWHANSGRWILDHGALPDADPFSVYPSINRWARTLLQGQWAGQVWLYGVFHVLGASGVIATRIVILGACLGLMAWRMARCGASARAQAAGVLAAAVVLAGFANDRPQLFSFLMFAALLVVLDLAEGRRKWLWAIPPLLIVWTNLHQGVLLGVLVTALQLGIRVWRDLAAGDRRSAIATAACIGAALICPFITPNGANGIGYLLWLEFEPSKQRISEYASPFRYLPMLASVPHILAFFTIAAGMLVALIRGARRFHPELLMPGLLLVLGLATYRYIPFAVLAGLPFLAAQFSLAPPRYRRAALVLALPLALSLFMMVGLKLPSILNRGISPGHFPVALVQEAGRHGISGKVFTSVGWGGYLSWEFGGAVRPYIDGRYLMNTERLDSYTHILWATPRGLTEFDAEHFDWVLMPLRNSLAQAERGYPLVDHLRQQADWRLLMATDQGVLFSRVAN